MFEPIPPIPEDGLGLGLSQTMTTQSSGNNTVKVDLATCKPGEDPSVNDDGPVFRATMRSLEQKTGHMRLRMKKVLRTAEAAEDAQRACNNAVSDFMDALKEASSSNANAVLWRLICKFVSPSLSPSLSLLVFSYIYFLPPFLSTNRW